MFGFGVRGFNSALIGHPGWHLFVFLLLQVSKCRSNSGANGVPYLLRGSVPGLPQTHLPEVCVQPCEVGQHCVQVDLRGLRTEPRACLFRKGSEREMQVVLTIEDQKWVPMLNCFWSRYEPVGSCHTTTRSPF